jgi:anti-sigma B factor antagonist
MQTVITRSQLTVIRPCGHINASTATAFQEELIASVSSEHNSALLVDMSQVESLDSAGLMALVSALTLAQQMEKPFSLCSVAPSIRIIFELTQLDRVFEIFDHCSGCEAAIA